MLKSRMISKIYSFFNVQRHNCGKNFHEDPFSSFYVKLLTDRHADRQTDKRRALHNVLGGGKYQITELISVEENRQHLLKMVNTS